ncbi:MAG: hypothetical protein JWR35_418 [Marmoricola sp.]|jgi:acyl carrier protein|nr:hypothetical protein [Marmoricola sp.]
MATSANTAENAIREFLRRTKKTDDIDLDTPLYGDDGIGLDSMDTAELSAILEDELGSDPYSAGLMPQTLREIVSFYNDDLVSES